MWGMFGWNARRAAACALALLLLAGCANSSEPDPTSSEQAAEDEDDEYTQVTQVVADMEVEGTGAAPFSWTGEGLLHVTRVGTPEIDVNLLTVGFAEPMVVTNDPRHRFRWSFDLLDDYRDRPGTFTIDDETNESGMHSLAMLLFMRVEDPTKPAVYDMEEVEFLKQFDQLAQPCQVEVGEDVLSGSLTCPELRSAEGESAGVRLSWTNGRVRSEDPERGSGDE